MNVSIEKIQEIRRLSVIDPNSTSVDNIHFTYLVRSVVEHFFIDLFNLYGVQQVIRCYCFVDRNMDDFYLTKRISATLSYMANKGELIRVNRWEKINIYRQNTNCRKKTKKTK